ncbi:hypothetical protein ACFS27_12045 [Promicromonospora vindobonensis]|uniref:Uncharacterized protein n=1 Tax=Promicromonospora vindobonensis TaxID=195748 RepID=A0ABW5VSK0_9MICO
MNRTSYDTLRDLAPTEPVDAEGLEVARAAFDRGLRTETVGAAFPVVGRGDRMSRRAGRPGRVLVAVTASVLLIGAGVAGAVLIRDIAQPAESGPPVGGPDPLTGSTVPPPSASPEDGPAVQCDDLSMSTDMTPEIPSSEWPDLMEHGWTLPDVPVTAPPTLQGAPAECAGATAAVVFADPADDRAVVVYERLPGLPPAPDRPLAEAEVGTVGSGDHHVAWTDEAGHQWYADAGGVSVEEFRAILGSLDYGADASVTGPVPDGFERVETPEIAPGTTLHLWRMWHNESLPYLWASWPATMPIEAALADGRDYTAVEFDGGIALYSEGIPGLSANPPSLRWEKDGVRFWLSDAGADLETLKARARSVRPLDLDDPELAPYLNR